MRSRFATLICLAGVLPGACGAQQSAAAPKTTPATYSLREVLVHLEDNLADYVANVPNIFCDEHVVSDIELPHRKRTFRTTTDSIFRLRRATEISAKANAFSESREAVMPFYPEKRVPIDAYNSAILDRVVVSHEIGVRSA